MKTIVKVIWFSLAITLRKYLGKLITMQNIGSLKDKLNAYSPIQRITDSLLAKLLPDVTLMSTVLFFTIVFLGLDVINGEMNGYLKGPAKFILHSVLYLIGFTVLFLVIGDAISITT